MKIINYKDSDFIKKIDKIALNNQEFDEKLIKDVENIINLVKKNQDEAIIEICNKFDKSSFKNSDDLLVKEEEIEESMKNIDPKIFL